VQRHRNHQKLSRRIGGKLGDGLGEHPSQSASRRMKAVIFEGMNRVSHAALVKSVGHRAHEGRRRQPAGPAQC
jgi:hypothetical protein